MSSVAVVSDIDDALSVFADLHPLPGVLSRARSIIKHEDTRISDLANLIGLDSSLTTDVMRVSNSASYGFASQATNLHTAIERFGFEEVLHIVAMCVSKNCSSRDLHFYGISAYEHWAHTVSVAILMEELAERIGENKNDAYTIGILHSIGRVAINFLLSDTPLIKPLSDTDDSISAERRLLGIDYAEAGNKLLRKWKFSNLICQPIEKHISGTDNARIWPLLQSLRFALDVVSVSDHGFTQGLIIDESQNYLMTYLLKQQELENILATSREKFREHQELLGVYA